MEKWININFTAASGIFISTIVIYIAVILLTRIFGKRSFSKMSSFDFAMTIAVGSVIASTMLSSSVSLLEGLWGLLLIYILQISAAFLRRYKFFEAAIDNTPLLLMDGATILHDNLKKARVTEADLRSKLRESNVLQLSQVQSVIFETTGDISVLHSEKNQKIDEWILKDVAR